MSAGVVGLISAATAFIIAHIIKIITRLAKRGNNNDRSSNTLLSSGGMPSVHTACITALTTVIGLNEGFDSIVFALALVLSIVISYDATHVRRAVGEQGKALKKTLPKDIEQPYNSLGHNIQEVFVGAVLGSLVGVIVNTLLL